MLHPPSLRTSPGQIIQECPTDPESVLEVLQTNLSIAYQSLTHQNQPGPFLHLLRQVNSFLRTFCCKNTLVKGNSYLIALATQLYALVNLYISHAKTEAQLLNTFQKRLLEINALEDSPSSSSSSSSSFGAGMGERGGEKRRLKRSNHSPEARAILFDWLLRHREQPYPTDSEKKMLVEKTGLTETQLNDWMVNARRRVLRRPTGKALALLQQYQ